MNFFKKKAFEDERIVNAKNKIYAEIYIVVVAISVISVILKYYIFNLGPISIVTELVILIVGGLYYVYRSTSLGIVSAEVEMHDSKNKWSQQKKNVVSSIALGVGIALVFGINSAVQYTEGMTQSITYFLLTAFVSLLIYLPFFFIFLVAGGQALKHRSDRAIDKMLDDASGDGDEKY